MYIPRAIKLFAMSTYTSSDFFQCLKLIAVGIKEVYMTSTFLNVKLWESVAASSDDIPSDCSCQPVLVFAIRWRWMEEIIMFGFSIVAKQHHRAAADANNNNSNNNNWCSFM